MQDLINESLLARMERLEREVASLRRENFVHKIDDGVERFRLKLHDNYDDTEPLVSKLFMSSDESLEICEEVINDEGNGYQVVLRAMVRETPIQFDNDDDQFNDGFTDLDLNDLGDIDEICLCDR